MRAKHHKLCREPKTKIYYARVQVSGIRRRFTFGKSRPAAEAGLRRLERDIAAGLIEFNDEHLPKKLRMEAVSDTLLSQLIEVHLEWAEINLSAATCVMRKRYTESFLNFHGDCMVSTLDAIAVDKFFSWAKANHSKSPNGGNVFVRHVRTLLFWADELGICRCPIRRFPQTPEILPENRRFSDEELGKLIATIPDSHRHFRDLVIFAVLTGLRPNEHRELRRDQLGQDARGDCHIFIQQHKTSRSSREPRPRSLPLSPEAAACVRRQIDDHPKSPVVFLDDDGKPYKQRALRNRLYRWCKRAGIQPRPPYSLRHTFGSLQAEANINQTSISQMMGHSSSRMAGRYIANNADHHKTAVRAIESRLKNIL
jgi:integrase